MAEKNQADDRGRELMQAAMKALNDPDIDAKIEAAETRKERRQELIIAGSHALRTPPLIRAKRLVDIDELRHYLTARNARPSNDGILFDLEIGGAPHALRAVWPKTGHEILFDLDGDGHWLPLNDDGTISSDAVEDLLQKLVG